MHASPCWRHNDMIAGCHSNEWVCGVEVQGGRSGPRSRPQGETRASQKLFVLEEDRERSICMCGTGMTCTQPQRLEHSRIWGGIQCYSRRRMCGSVYNRTACIFSLKVCRAFWTNISCFTSNLLRWLSSTQAVSS